MINQCFICGLPVLGLAGQDAVLDTFVLVDEPEDFELVRASKFGDVHLCCLAHDNSRHLWYQRRLRNLVHVRSYCQVWNRGRFSGFLSPSGSEIALVEEGLDVCIVDYKTFSAAQLIGASRHILFDEPLLWEMEPCSEFFRLASQLRGRESIELEWLINALGVRNCTRNVDAMHLGRLDACRSGESIAGFEGSVAWISARKRYPLVVENAMWGPLHDAAEIHLRAVASEA